MGNSEQKSNSLEWIKAIGMPVVTLLVTVVGGFLLTDLTKSREAQESNERLYAQLLTQREQSDATIRKEMFGLVITKYMAAAGQPVELNDKVLQLELLATNFNQSLDLAPLFKDLARSLDRDAATQDPKIVKLRKRLDDTAGNVITKQVTSLALRGYSIETEVSMSNWEKNYGKPVIDVDLPLSKLSPGARPATGQPEVKVRIRLEIVGFDLDRNEVEVRLRANFSNGTDRDVDRHFIVGRYDFPMLDNTQLAYGLRTSIVMTEFFVPENPESEEVRVANTFTRIHLVVFPAASASFKERQDYDDILLEIFRAKARVDAVNSSGGT